MRSTSPRHRLPRRKRLMLEALESRHLLDAGLPIISELMAVNQSTLADGYGDYSDWIEIHNPGPDDVDLQGWYLTDSAADLRKWQFPAVTLAAGDYLVVFASGREDDFIDGQGNLHTSFRLAAGGESVALVASDGQTVVDAYWDYPEQLPDVSYGAESTTLIERGADATVLIPADDSLATAWTEIDFTTGPEWFSGATGVGYDVTGGGLEPSNPLRIDFSQSGAAGPTQAGWQAMEHDGTSTAVGSFPNNELAGPGGSVEVRLEGQTHWRDYAAATGVFAPLSDLLSDGPLCNAPATMTLSLGNLRDGTYEITTYHHATQFGPSERPPATPFDVYLTDALVTHQTIALGAEMSDNTAAELSQLTFPFTVVGGSPVQIDFVRGPSEGQGDHFALPGFELALAAEPAVGDLVTTDVAQQMHDTSGSAYVRIPFELGDGGQVSRLRLRMKYDDGFVAYLNGTRVAARNAPEEVAFNATATAERAVSEALKFEEIELSEFADRLRPGTNVLAVHGLNHAAGDEDFLILPELIAVDATGIRYMTVPTPGAPNAEGLLGVVADTRFSVDRGFFDAPFVLEITTDTPGAEIRYTVDGSLPTATHGAVYTGPITVDRLTALRAAAFKPDHIPSNVDTQTYVFLDDVVEQTGAGFPDAWGILADYAMEDDPAELARIAGDPNYALAEAKQVVADSLRSLPTLSIVMDVEDVFGRSRGIYANPQGRGYAWERPASVELIYPDGTTGFQENAGIRIQGFTSRNPSRNPKHSMRLVFRGQYGATKLEYPLFGESATDEFDTIVLRSNAQDAWVYDVASNRLGTFARDQWAHETQAAMGQPAVSSNYVHLYINGLYWGVYNPTERPDASFGEAYFGGDKDDYDVLKNHEEVLDGNNGAYRELLTLIQRDPDNFGAGYRNLSSDEAYEEVLQYVDVHNLADYMIHNMYAATTDWPGNNYIGRNRVTGEGFRFFDWDTEHAFKTSISTNRTGAHSRDRDSPTKIHHALRSNEEYRMLFAEHVRRAFSEGGALYVNPEHPRWDPEHPEWNVPAARWMEIAGRIEPSLIAEAARWGDYAHDAYGLNELFTPHDQYLDVQNDLLNNWFPYRSQIVLNQFRAQGMYPSVDAPQFRINGVLQQGSAAAAGDELTMTDVGATVYYTLDGTDPRLPDGAISGSAIEYTGPIVLDQSEQVRARAKQGDNWSFLHEAEFLLDGLPVAAMLVIGELNYNPYAVTDAELQLGFDDKEEFEFVELLNVSHRTIDLTGLQFTDGIEYQFEGRLEGNPLLITEISTGYPDYIEIQNVSTMPFVTSGWIVAANDTGSGDVNEVHETLWELPDEVGPGEVLYQTDLEDDHYWGGDVFWRTRGNGWAMMLDDEGNVADFVVWGYDPSELAALNVNVGGFQITAADVWVGEAVPAEGSADNSLQRIGNLDHHDASDWGFTEPSSKGATNGNLLTPFSFPGSGVPLAPGQRLVLARNPAAFATRYGAEVDVFGPYLGSLRNSGEQITLAGPSGSVLLSFRYDDQGKWPDAADGRGASLELVDPWAEARTDADRAAYFEDGRHWRRSVRYGGTPGGAPQPAVGVVVNEVFSRSDPPLVDWIELHNTTDTAVDVGGWYLSDSANDLKKYRFGAETVIPPGGYLVVDERDFNPVAVEPGQVPFALNGNRGDQVWLLKADASGSLTHFADRVAFDAAASGESFGRWPDGSGPLAPAVARTPGGPNGPPRVGPVVISEVHYQPDLSADAVDFEFVEVYNPTHASVDLGGWQLADAVQFDFPAETTLASKAVLVVVPFDLHLADKLTAFREAYGIGASVQLLGGYSGRLDNSGERVQLLWPGQPPTDEPQFVPTLLEDEVEYAPAAPWPVEAAGAGQSLTRLGSKLWGNDPQSWAAASPTPGTVDMIARVVDRHVFYNHSAFDRDGDNDALATDKEALLPGNKATFANYTSYVRGLNGVMIDVADLADAAGLSASDDFELKVGNDDDPGTWLAAPAPQSVTVDRGAGVNGSDRVSIIWADHAVRNQWLQVTVLATANTGLAEPDVFYFGNAVGEAGNSTLNAVVNTTDEIAARNYQHGPTSLAAVDDPYDYNRDALVNATDRAIARANQTGPTDMLRLIAAPTSDVALAPAVEPQAGHLEASLGKPAWLDALEPTGTSDRATGKDEPAEEAVDALLAAFWQ